MNTENMSDEDLSLLTDEERAGLEDESDDDSDDAGEVGDAGDDGAGDLDVAAAPGADAPAAAADASQNQAGQAAGRDDGKDDDDDEPAPAAPAGDRLDPKAVQTQLDEIQSEKDKLAEQLDDGEITTKEYTEAVDKLNDQKNEVANKLARQEEQDNAIVTAWNRDVDKFLSKHPTLKASEAQLVSFDSVVRRVTGDQANASLSNRKQLEKAHEIWRAEMGFKDEPAASEKKAGETGKAAKPPKPKTELPPTLHNVPAADIEVGDDGKYSYLDSLLNAGKSIEYEDALAKLSEADQQDYLSRA